MLADAGFSHVRPGAALPLPIAPAQARKPPSPTERRT
jgi:hypothetical protein